jgi:2-amino-4-hydroxy-6-hydroxymethyldihydropteridine diphosphokinase
MPEVCVAVGSNVDREKHVREGLRLMRARFGSLRLSPVYETEPVGFQGSLFLNLVVAFESDLPVREIASTLRDIEHRCGRIHGAKKFAPRPLDLDLLLYGDVIVSEPGLKLPREEILRYGFVLKPLADLVPQKRHPVAGGTYEELWSVFEGEGKDVAPFTLDAS